MFPHNPVINALPAAPRWRSGSRLGQSLMIVAAVLATTVCAGEFASALHGGGSRDPDFGPNVKIFDPSMPTTEI